MSGLVAALHGSSTKKHPKAKQGGGRRESKVKKRRPGKKSTKHKEKNTHKSGSHLGLPLQTRKTAVQSVIPVVGGTVDIIGDMPAAEKPVVTPADRRRVFQQARTNFCRKHARVDVHRPPKDWRTQVAPEQSSPEQSDDGLYESPFASLRYPVLMSLLDMNPDVQERAKNKKKVALQTAALGKIKATCMNQSRNKQFVSTASKALQKWKDVQTQLDADLSHCTLVKVDVLKQTMTFKQNVKFSGGGAEILAESGELMGEISLAVNSLKNVLISMKEPMIHFSIEGHVHPTKDAEKCLMVSNQRAKRVAAWLALRGVPEEYLHCRGFGGTQPLSLDPSRSNENRRVQIILMSSMEVQEQYASKEGKAFRKKDPAPAAIPRRRRRQSVMDKEAAMWEAVRSISQEKKDELRSVFMLFDKDGSGELDADEVTKLLNLLGQNVSSSEAEELIKAVDVDGNGELDFNEFLYAVCGDHDHATRMKLQGAFDMYDVDKSGKLDRGELLKMGSMLSDVFTEDDLDGIISAADKDGDGEIDGQEFINLLLHGIAEKGS
jgi:calmodulin